MYQNQVKHIALVLIAVMAMLSSCYNQHEPTSDAWNLSDNAKDSISFFTTHHYSQNYNFVVKADSIRLVCQQPDELPFDSATVYDDDRVVVADIMFVPTDTLDSVWVKIARDQSTMGWIHESELLKKVVPADSISQFIDSFSNTHLLIFLALFVLVAVAYGLHKLSSRNAYIVHFHDINSFYPTILALLVAVSATFYASIQLFAPETWRHFYYHPSLNPFGLPTHLGLFVASVWAILIMTLAAVQDVWRLLPHTEAILYLASLAGICAVDYVIFSISTLYYIGYFLLPLYAYFCYRRFFCCVHYRYICGNCGAPLFEKGVCPHCGAMNK